MRNSPAKLSPAVCQVPGGAARSGAAVAGPGEVVCGVGTKGAGSLFPLVTCGALRGTLPVWPETSNDGWKL